MTLNVELRTRGDGATTLHQADFDVDADNPLTFGRAAAHNRLHLPDTKRMVSSRHGRIERRGDDYFVVDLGSVNGTTLDDRPVEPEAPLGNGGRISVGDFDIVVTVTAAGARAGARPSPGADATMTMVNVDPDRAAAEIWSELCRRHSSQRRAASGERAELLATELRHLLDERGLMPPQARAVLKRIAARAGGGSAAPSSGGAPPAEELLQTGFGKLQKLAQSLVPDCRLTRPNDVARFVQQLDVFVQLTTTWLVQCLKGRAEFENQFGAEVTMVFQRSNNPLKSLLPKDLSSRLFDWRGDRPAGEQQAQLEGVLRDLTQHQLGLLGGVTEAIRSVTERLAPEAIETLAQKDAGLLTSKGAKAWEIYQKIYKELLEEKSKLFHEVISPAIRKGYLMVHESGPKKDPDQRRG